MLSCSNEGFVWLKSLGVSLECLRGLARNSEAVWGISQEYSSSYFRLSDSDPTKGVLMKNPEKHTQMLIDFCCVLILRRLFLTVLSLTVTSGFLQIAIVPWNTITNIRKSKKNYNNLIHQNIVIIHLGFSIFLHYTMLLMACLLLKLYENSTNIYYPASTAFPELN